VEGQVENDNDQAIRDLCARLDALVEQLDKLAAMEEHEAVGIEHVVRTPVIRPQHKVEPPPSSKAARASSRGPKASGDAAVPPEADGWKFGAVGCFDQIGLTGTIVFLGSKGTEEAQISVAAFRNSGLTNLFAGERVEGLIESRGNGRKEVVDLKLAPAARRMEALRANSHVEAVRPNPHIMMVERARAMRDRYPGW
jgi:hypothetical protein